MANRLLHETSPYLLQHAENPVDWWPWCDEALARARSEDKPILLSIGYSACHWCHVMAHESFEDAEVAGVMNRLFINIKVDREERPDLDQIYQTAHQMLAQQPGGWPLTLFLAPDGTPFFCGTYFPRSPRHGLPGFVNVLERVGEAWREQRGQLEAQNEELRAALAGTLPQGGAHHSEFSAGPLTALCDLLAAGFDKDNGGFGDAPKFPHPADLDFLLRHHFATGGQAARDMVLLSLKRMAEGGIYDQLGGGFCRYSTDARWQIPHFEKMLYDNGPLLALYADAWVLTGESLFARVAEETAAWALREMRLPDAAFAASLDADSEGEEGRFYVWDRDELRSLLSDDEYLLLARHYGVDRPPNFENRLWHLAVAVPIEEVAASLGLSPEDARSRLDGARHKLLLARERRVRPGRDDKVLTGWNALMIRGLARAARIFGRADWRAAAQAAVDSVNATLWRDGRLLATCKDGRAHLDAYLDDHAWLLAALLEMMEDEFRPVDLAFAQDIADALVDSFQDTDGGGFFFTRDDHERLILRPKSGHDNATPAGNGVAAWALGRLGHLTGEQRYLDAAEHTLQAFYAEMRASPAGYASMATALGEWLAPPAIVVVRGPTEALLAWRRKLGARFRPSVAALVLGAEATGLPPVLDKPVPYIVNAWVCRGVKCLPAVSDWESLDALLPEIGKAGDKD